MDINSRVLTHIRVKRLKKVDICREMNISRTHFDDLLEGKASWTLEKIEAFCVLAGVDLCALLCEGEGKTDPLHELFTSMERQARRLISQDIKPQSGKL